MKQCGIKVGIITDGRVEGQQNKIQRLGLVDKVEDIIITDSLCGIQFRKTNDISFRIMQSRWRIPFESMIYLGDNISKDFQVHKQLGMKWVWINNEDGLYYDKNHNMNITTELSSVADLHCFLENILDL